MYMDLTAMQKMQLKSCKKVSYAFNIQYLLSSRSCLGLIHLSLNRKYFLNPENIA